MEQLTKAVLLHFRVATVTGMEPSTTLVALETGGVLPGSPQIMHGAILCTTILEMSASTTARRRTICLCVVSGIKQILTPIAYYQPSESAPEAFCFDNLTLT
jgi:hypothetical protein